MLNELWCLSTGVSYRLLGSALVRSKSALLPRATVATRSLLATLLRPREWTRSHREGTRGPRRNRSLRASPLVDADRCRGDAQRMVPLSLWCRAQMVPTVVTLSWLPWKIGAQSRCRKAWFRLSITPDDMPWMATTVLTPPRAGLPHLLNLRPTILCKLPRKVVGLVRFATT